MNIVILKKLAVLLPLLTVLLPCSAWARDWPMWRGDAGRRGSTREELPETLHLQWVLELPPPLPAWPSNQETLQFDSLYEPVLMGKRLFVPSMRSDKLAAYDSDSGRELWSFFADGPVRFAAACWKENVYFVSDDGYLYCLRAQDGVLLWKFRGGPSEARAIGNGRVVSLWPARGAPVVIDGTVYFGASIWPFMGIFLHALDAETGAVVWTNSGTGSSYLKQQHDSPAFAGVAPQGYLAATEDYLIVSGGRTMPAVFDRHTGEFLHFNVSSRSMGSRGGGGFDVVAAENFYINRGSIYRLDTGAFIEALDALLVTDEAVICHDTEGIRAYRPRWEEVKVKDRRGETQRKADVRKIWTTPVEDAVERVSIQAGGRLYCQGEKNRILAIDVSDIFRGAKMTWSVELSDEPLNMIAGDGKLFVSTRAGRIYCFGGSEPETPVAVPELEGAQEEHLVPRGARWKYLDGGRRPETGWRAPGFDDSGWHEGLAPLGYGGNNENTRIRFGRDPRRKALAYYFRRLFEVPKDTEFTALELAIRADDGALVHLNGREVARLRMPSGSADHETPASALAEDESRYDRFELPPDLIAAGLNVLAVQVHQHGRTSSDVAFDLELRAEGSIGIPEIQAGRPDRFTDLASEILDVSGSREGYCLVLGLGSGRLAEELAAQSKLHTVVIDRDAAAIDLFRARMDALGVYGTRVAAIAADPMELPLAEFLADLIACEDLEALGPDPARAVEKVFRSLRPYSGAACIPASGPRAGDLASTLREADLDGGRVESARGLLVLRRLDAPSGSADWTHQYGDAANTVSSRDSRVKAPLGLLWFGGPSNEGVLPRHGHGPTPHVVRGRLFIEGRDMIRAVDIYTGRLLWERQLKDLGKAFDYASHEPGANLLGSNYVSLADGVYVVHDDACLRLDPASGKTLAEFELPRVPGQTERTGWGSIGIWRDVLVAGASPTGFRFPDFSARELEGIKDGALRAAFARIEELVDFEPAARERGQHDHDYLAEVLNQLLLDDDMVARIPLKVRHKADAEALERDLETYLHGVPGRRATDYQAVVIKRRLLKAYYGLPGYDDVPAGKFGSMLRSGSRKLVALDRHTGRVLWEREAAQHIRHNTIALGSGKVFYMDRMSDAQADYYRRRGVPVDGHASITVLDIDTGEVLWSATEDIFGTWLGYSEAEDVLLEAGSKAHDRARDEVGKGMRAYRGATGDVLWSKDLEYAGPCMLLGREVITQGESGSRGFALDIQSGVRKKRPHPISGEPVDWVYTRNYGCNTAIASPNLLTFRSAAAGYYDLAGDGGTGNLGGFRSGCTTNLIPAGGILNAPDYTRDCTCAYQNQASLALVHMPETEMWTFHAVPFAGERVERLGLNFGAPGDRRGPDGTYWLDYPSVGGPSPDLDVDLAIEDPKTIRHHSSRIAAGALEWVAASALAASGEITIALPVPNPLRVDNELRDGPPLEAHHAAVAARVPVRVLPRTGQENDSSLRKRSGREKLDARIRGHRSLAPSSLTVEFWVRGDRDADYIDARVSGKDANHGFVIDNRKLRVRYYVADEDADGNEDAVTIEAKDEIPKDQWVHVAFTYDAASGTGTLHRDGKAVGRHEGPDGRALWWDTIEPEYRVLKDLDTSDVFLDELRILGVALTPEKFLLGAARETPEDRLIGHWRMAASAAQEEGGAYAVRFVFAELDGLGPGERVFDVRLQGRKILDAFDISREAGGPYRTIVREARVRPQSFVRIGLRPRQGRVPLICGLELIRTQESLRDL